MLIAAARGGQSGALVIRGDPGIGKSALLRAAHARASGLQVAEVRAFAPESSTPFSALSMLVLPFRNHLGSLLEHQAAVLAAAVGLGPPSPTDRYVIGAATLALLAAIAEAGPLLVTIDDAHWLDVESKECLVFAARRLEAEGIVMVFATRDNEPASLPDDMLPAMSPALLSPDEGRRLLAEGNPELPPAVVAGILHLASGNPLALLELPELLTPEQRDGVTPLTATSVAGGSLEAAFAERIGRLGDDVRMAVLVAAVTDTPDFGVVGAACQRLGIDPAFLRRSTHQTLVTVSGDEAHFRHPLMRSAALSNAHHDEINAAHHALADVLAASAPERAAWHSAAGTIVADESVALALERAAAEGIARNAYAAAGRSYERAAELSPAPTAAMRRLLEAAHAMHAAGHSDAARTLCKRALTAGSDPIMRIDALHLLGVLHALAQSAPEGIELLLQAVSSAEKLDTARVVRLLADVVMIFMQAGQFGEAFEYAGRAIEIASETDEPLRRLARLSRAGPAAAVGAAHIPIPEDEVTAGLATSGVDPLMPYRIAVSQLTAALLLEQYDDGRNLANRLIADGRTRSPSVLLYPLVMRAKIEFRSGTAWNHAVADLAEVMRLSEELGQPAFGSLAHGTRALIEAARGNEEACAHHSAIAISIADQTGSAVVDGFCGTATALVRHIHGDHEGAIVAAEPHVGWMHEVVNVEPGLRFVALPTLIEAYIAVGRHDDARENLELLERRAGERDRIWGHAAAARCRGLLASGGDAQHHFNESLRWYRRSQTPFEEARTCLAYGQWLTAVDRQELATTQLGRAATTFDRLGCRLLADQARTLLTSTEQLPPRRNPTDVLTPQEFQVAFVVASGMTNREAGSALFLSPKTVENYLVRIYRKLSVRNRTELARVITDG